MKYLILFFIFVSCQDISTVEEMRPETYYKPDIQVKYDGKTHYGWGVLKYNEDKYKLKIESPGNISLLKVTTCARFDSDEPGGGIFKNEKKYDYKFKPDVDLELKESCVLLIESYEKGVKGRHSFGIFELDGGKHSKDKLEASVKCNGETTNHGGVSMCVSLQGILQQVIFDTKVRLGNIKDKCKIESEDGFTWTFETPNRECVYIFKEVGSDNTHRHLSVGFEDVAVRGK